MATPLRILSLRGLEEAKTFTVVWDKVANKFFKLADSKWVTSDLTTMTSEDLAKKRVRIYEG